MSAQQDEITRILVVEDEPEQAQLIFEEFARAHSSWEVELARTAAECTARLEQAGYDVLLLDYVLPDEDGLALLRSLKGRFPEMVVIIMTAFGDEDVAAEALRAGADDYVSKLGAWVDVLCAATERCLAARAETRKEREMLRNCQAMLDHVADLMFILAGDGSMLFIGGPTRELLGYAPEELIGTPPGTHVLAPEQIPELKQAARRLAEAGSGTEHLTVHALRKDGVERWFRASLSPHTDAQGNVAGLVGTGQDITEELATARELDRRNRELACLQAVTSALHAHLDVEEATTTAVAELTNHELADAAAILLVNEHGTDVDFRTDTGFSAETLRAYQGEANLVWRGLVGSSVETGQATIFGPEEVAHQGIHGDLLLAEGFDNAMAVPTRIGEQVIGALLVMRGGQPYDERDAEVISTISDQIAMTAATARIHQQVSLGLAGSNRVLEVTLAINAHRDLDEILHSVAEAAAEVGNGIGAAVMLLDEAGQDFDLMFVAPADEQDAEGVRTPQPDGIAHETLRTGKALFVTDETETHPQIRQCDLDQGVRSVVSLPLAHGDQAMGVLAVRRATVAPLDPVRVRALTMLAAQAAQAIDNTRLLQRAQHAEALYRELFDHAGVPVMVFEPGGIITMVNAQFEELSGYSRDELEGKIAIFDLVHPQDVPCLREDHLRRIEGKRDITHHYTFRGVPKDGQIRWLEGAIHLMPDGRTATAVIIDTTEARQLQRQVMQSEKAAALGQLVSGVAHELNNPLTAILGYSQLLQIHGDVKSRAQAAAIEGEAKRSQSIIESLLSFARERPAEITPTNVNEVLDRTLQMSAYRMRVDNIHVHAEFDRGLPPIEADPHQLQQVFLNIINNAHYAMRRLSGEGELFVSTHHAGDVARVLVRDTGPGMSKQEANRAFDPFFTTKDVGEGTGLGLSVSQGIIERHGGCISLETAEGEGATFVIELPIQLSEAAARVEAPQAPPEHLVSGRVLVVDDEKTLVNLIQQALELEGHHVDTALDVQQAMELLAANDYDVILSDLRMPGLDGEYLLNHVLETRPELAQRFVIVTGDTATPETRQLLDRPDIRSLPKPFGIQELQRMVAEVIGPGRVGQ